VKQMYVRAIAPDLRLSYPPTISIERRCIDDAYKRSSLSALVS
jgi:hypothetical protein